jgi:hypothetical protein
MIAHQDKITASNLQKVIEVCKKLGINPDHLMMSMFKETAGTFSPSIKNPTSSATGLIQFMEKTAKQLGTTTAQLRAMTFNDQMNFVYKYFLPYKGRLKNFYDVYLAIFFPAAIGKNDDWRFPNWVYRANRGLDTNKNGYITLGEWKKWALTGQKKYASKANSLASNSSASKVVIPLILLSLGLFLFKAI